MIRTVFLATLSSCLCTGILISQQSQAPRSAETVMRRAASTYSALTSFQADFKQQLEDKFVDHEEARGVLYQRGDSLFAMHFSKPKGGAIIMDGRDIWIYEPSDLPGQVVKRPIPDNPVYGVNVLGWLLDKPNEKYRAVWLREESLDRKPVDVIRLEPLNANPPFRSATIWIDRGDQLPRKLQIDERHQVRIVTLSKLQTNKPIAATLFRFIPPSGIRVLEQK